MRILPYLNNYVNEDWISDKVRFSYDGIKRQRLLKIFVSTKLLHAVDKTEMVNISSQKVLKIFAEQFYEFLRNDKLLHVQNLLGKSLDVETLFSLKMFSNNWFTSSSFSYEGLTNFPNIDSRNFYLAPELTKNIENSEYIILGGLNIRLEFPILNIKIRKLVKNSNLVVLNWGPSNLLNYNYFNLGSSMTFLPRLLKGKHLISKLFIKRSILFLCGTTIYKYLEKPDLFNAFTFLSKTAQIKFYNLFNYVLILVLQKLV